MSKHGRCVICREFPFIHYYSEGWAQLSASQGCAQHGGLWAQRGPTKPLSLTLLSPFLAHPRLFPCTHPLHPLPSTPPSPGQTPDRFTQLTCLTLGSLASAAPIWELSCAPICQCHKCEGEKCVCQKTKRKENEKQEQMERKEFLQIRAFHPIALQFREFL